MWDFMSTKSKEDLTGALRDGWEPFAADVLPDGFVLVSLRREAATIRYTPEAQDEAFLRKEALGMLPSNQTDREPQSGFSIRTITDKAPFTKADIDWATETARTQALKEAGEYLSTIASDQYVDTRIVYAIGKFKNGKIPE